MKEQIGNVYALAGKTITRGEQPSGDALFLAFSDGTFAYMEATSEYGTTGLYVSAAFNPRWFDVPTLERMGVLTPEEMAAQIAQKQTAEQADEARERAEYERLRKRFEGVTG